MNYWKVKVHTTLGCTGMWGRYTIGWTTAEVWYLCLDHVDIDLWGVVILGSRLPDGVIAPTWG
jgi:hypothetical protein